MTLSTLPERIKYKHIIIVGFVLLLINVLINQFIAVSRTQDIVNAVYEMMTSFAVTLALVLIYSVSKKNAYVFNRTLLWLVITLVCWSLGDALYLYLTYKRIDPFISPVDFFYIAATLSFIVSVLTIAGSPPPSRRRNMVFIEISILILSAMVIFSILLLLRGTPDLNFDTLTLLMVFIYPVMDIIAIWIIMILFFTYPLKKSQKVLGILLAGAFCIFLSDLFYLLYSLYESMGRYYLIDTGYFFYYFLLLLAGFTGFKEFRKQTNDLNESSAVFKQNNWIVFLPGVFLITLIGLLLVFVFKQMIVMSYGIIVIIVFIIILFIIHQYLVVVDNIKLTREMRYINAQLESKVEQRTLELSRANIELQEEMKEREKAEEHLAKSNQDLALLNRDKDKLFTILAHDLRSPLGSMMNLSSLLVENIKDFDENELLEVVDTLNKSASQTFKLLNDLLAWSTVQMGKGVREKELFKVSEVVSEIIIILTSEANRKQIEIPMNIDPEIVAYADKFAIQTVIRNLVGNAVKFTENHGSITVSAVEKYGKVEISVSDNGIGISKDKQKKIFRVDTVSSSPGTDGEKGTGFGLLLCKDLVERNGGKIWFESEKGKGSTFHFTLHVNKEDTMNLGSTEHKQNIEDIRIEYKLDEIRRLGFTTLFGEFNPSLLNIELNKLWSSENFNPNYSVLIDIRKAKFKGDNKDIPEFLSVFNYLPISRTNRKFAVLTETPEQVAYSTMFGQFVKSNFPLNVEVFSTYDAAMVWLGV